MNWVLPRGLFYVHVCLQKNNIKNETFREPNAGLIRPIRIMGGWALFYQKRDEFDEDKPVYKRYDK